MTEDFSVSQKRALAVFTVLALAFAAYFLRGYVLLIAVAAVLAYLFNPLYRRLLEKTNVGLSATVTL
ncbi:MAG: AI-2E family transporter, partial [Mycobacterium sp.]